MKTICIYHSRDLDGWMSAAIVKKWFKETYKNSIDIDAIKEKLMDNHGYENLLFMLGWDYGDAIPNLSEYGKVIMVDVSFPKEDMWKLRSNLGEDFIWIDHHKSAINDNIPKDHKTPVFSGLQNPKFAACELTWKYLMQGMSGDLDKESENNSMPEIVRLLGRYDCFGHKGTDEEQKVLEFQYGARSCISNYEEAYQYLTERFDESAVYEIHQKGITIYQYLCTEAKQTYSKAFPIKFIESVKDNIGENIISRKFLCVNQERFNPINFGIDYHKDGYDGFACFWYKDGKWNWSLYNDNEEVDCSIIAKQYGGGGHKGASGFITDDISNILINNL